MHSINVCLEEHWSKCCGLCVVRPGETVAARFPLFIMYQHIIYLKCDDSERVSVFSFTQLHVLTSANRGRSRFSSVAL